MPIKAEDVDRIESFRAYIEDSTATDDRYGPVQRLDSPGDGVFASRWEVAPSCWFEVAVDANIPHIRVAFLTDDEGRSEAVQAAITDSEQGLDGYVAAALHDAGLSGTDPQLEAGRRGNFASTMATLPLDELRDLEDDPMRDKILRILEGFLIAFSPALLVDDLEE